MTRHAADPPRVGDTPRQGIKTPQRDIDLIKARLKRLKEMLR